MPTPFTQSPAGQPKPARCRDEKRCEQPGACGWLFRERGFILPIPLFRAPYGELDARVARIVAEEGMVSIQYDLASGDPDPRISTKRLLEYVTSTARRGSIVVMHMNGRGWKTADALSRIILRLRKKGYQLVTVSELLGRPPAPAISPDPAAPGLSAL